MTDKETLDEMALRILDEMYKESAQGKVREVSFDLDFARRLLAEQPQGETGRMFDGMGFHSNDPAPVLDYKPKQKNGKGT